MTYKKPVAHWSFDVWWDVDDRPHVDWSVSTPDETVDGTFDGLLEGAIFEAFEAAELLDPLLYGKW